MTPRDAAAPGWNQGQAREGNANAPHILRRGCDVHGPIADGESAVLGAT